MRLFFAASVSIGLLLPLSGSAAVVERIEEYPNGIDALSVTLSAKDNTIEVSGKTAKGTWSEWETLVVDDEQDPLLLESNLAFLPEGTTSVKIRGGTGTEPVHPIRVTQDGIRYSVASLIAAGTPRILSRAEWGANDSLLIAKSTPSTSSSSSSAPSVLDRADSGETARERECSDMYAQYPEEFKASTPVTKNEKGERLRWPLQYSPSIRLLAVHHTAGKVTGEARSGVERMRAIYEYHTQSRGWGDIGYHYVVDEEGQIYEGRQGGDYVVAGHAYCNNVGTIGIALMGNFDVEQPTPEQTQSLQWLLKTLADKYHIDTRRDVLFHGDTLPAIVGHRQLVSTTCPGKTLWEGLEQIRSHVKNGDTGAPVKYPAVSAPASASSSARGRASRSSAAPAVGASGLRALGSTKIEGRPGGELLLSLLYTPDGAKKRGSKVASVKRSNPRLQLFQEQEGGYVPTRSTITSPKTISEEDALPIRIKVKLPPERTSYTLMIGDIRYDISVSGKRTRTTTDPAPTRQSYFPDSIPVRRASAAEFSSASRASSSSSSVARVVAVTGGSSPLIRIRLNDASLPQGIATIQGSMTVDGVATTGPIALDRDGSLCRVSAEGKILRSGDAVRLIPTASPLAVTTFKSGRQRFRGTIECRVIDGQLVLINELPLEEYMAGLGEEPDTEPYEKQRAFAIAARTYAAYYADPLHRKFPGKPYDGSDSPADFQLYGGLDFEERHAAWVRAVRSTASIVLKVGSEVIRPPYFSSDDGRTRSPEEVGWKSFPFASVFASKPDPWCEGESLRGHGVGMSGCGAEGQANEGRSGEEILQYYYPGTNIVAY